MDVEKPPAAPMDEERQLVVRRRIAAALFVVAFLLDVLGDPAALAAVSKLCGL